jgi:site-specific DNA recombinase
MRMAAIYARVSSEQQREANTIASQTTSLIEFAQGHDLEVPKEWVFEMTAIVERRWSDRAWNV